MRLETKEAVGERKRIVGFDLARALAILGMVIVNFKITMGAEQNGPSWMVHLVGLLDGRAAATFVVLAGVGISLLSGPARASHDLRKLAECRRTLLKRALFLFVVGLLYTPIWPADILHFYGVYIAASVLFLASSTRRLWEVSGILVVTFAVLLLAFDYSQGWDWKTLEYEGLWTLDGMVRHLFYNGFHPVIPWLAFLFIGMAIGRLDMRNPQTRNRIFMLGAGVALVAEFVSWLLVKLLSSGTSLADQDIIVAIFGTAPMPPMPLYMLAGSGTAAAVIAASVALGEKYDDTLWLRSLVSTGQLALTIYVAHVLLGMGVLEAFGRLENQTLSFALFSAFAFFGSSILFAHLWRKWFARGPLEAMLRFFTVTKKRPE